MDVDIYISRERNMMGIVNKHDFTGQMAALALVDLKMQLSKIKEANLGQRLCGFRRVVPKPRHNFGVRRAIGSQDLAHIDIGTVQRILFPEAVFAFILQPQTPGGFFAGEHFVKQRQ